MIPNKSDRPEPEARTPKPAWMVSLIGAWLVAGAWVACLGIGALFTWIGTAHGCQLDESGIHPCLVFGVDVGTPLSFLSVGLLLLAAFGLPLFLIGFLGLLVTAFVLFFISRLIGRR